MNMVKTKGTTDQLNKCVRGYNTNLKMAKLTAIKTICVV